MLGWLFNKDTPTDEKDFVSLSSHELRTPLSVIKWYTEMLLDGDAGPLTEDQKKYLATIQSSNQQAIDLVRSLLNVSRLDLGTFCINPSSVDMVLLLDEVLLGEERLRAEKEINVVREGGEHSSFVTTDRKMALVVIKNIIANAFIFSNQGGSVTINVSNVPKAGTFDGHFLEYPGVVLSVTDNGIGIPKAEQSQVFMKMFKGTNTKEVDSPGSGLGLYVAHEAMKHLKGDVWFTSDARATTFRVFFPHEGVRKKEGRTSLD